MSDLTGIMAPALPPPDVWRATDCEPYVANRGYPWITELSPDAALYFNGRRLLDCHLPAPMHHSLFCPWQTPYVLEAGWVRLAADLEGFDHMVHTTTGTLVTKGEEVVTRDVTRYIFAHSTWEQHSQGSDSLWLLYQNHMKDVTAEELARFQGPTRVVDVHHLGPVSLRAAADDLTPEEAVRAFCVDALEGADGIEHDVTHVLCAQCDVLLRVEDDHGPMEGVFAESNTQGLWRPLPCANVGQSLKYHYFFLLPRHPVGQVRVVGAALFPADIREKASAPWSLSDPLLLDTGPMELATVLALGTNPTLKAIIRSALVHE